MNKNDCCKPVIFKNYTEWLKFEVGGWPEWFTHPFYKPTVGFIEERCEELWLNCNGGRN